MADEMEDVRALVALVGVPSTEALIEFALGVVTQAALTQESELRTVITDLIPPLRSKLRTAWLVLGAELDMGAIPDIRFASDDSDGGYSA